MVEWLAVWGATQAVEFLFKPVLEDLAKDAAKNWAKDLFKGALGNVLKLPSPKEQQKAAGKALKEFLQLVQQELEDADLTNDEVKAFAKPLKRFIKDKTVIPILGAPFQPDFTSLDIPGLMDGWRALDLPDLPGDFNWELVCKRFVKKVNAIRLESEEMRKTFDSENLKQIAGSVERLAGVTPDFDLKKYKEGLLERYGYLNMESLDTAGSAYNAVRLWRMFIPQTVRECREFMPQMYEIPKEVQRRLRKRGEMEEALPEEELERYRKAYQEQPIHSWPSMMKRWTAQWDLRGVKTGAGW